jgi:AcrR family transcriptional regulator
MPKVPEGYLHERRRHILVAASRVFSRRGVQAATMTEVATEAGISPGLIYRYFPSKEELVTCAISEGAAEIEARWMESPDGSEDPMGDFRELSDRTFEIMNQPGEQQQTVLHLEQFLSAVRDSDATALEAACGTWDGIVQNISDRFDAAQRAGQLDPEIDTLALAQVCLQFYWGTRLRKMVAPDYDIQPSVEMYGKLIDALVAQPWCGPAAATAKSN